MLLLRGRKINNTMWDLLLEVAHGFYDDGYDKTCDNINVDNGRDRSKRFLI